jgi:hypothetical protein
MQILKLAPMVLIAAIAMFFSPFQVQAQTESNVIKKYDVSFPVQLSNPQLGSSKFVLNGIALRKKLVFKVYAAGLYLEEKSNNAESILESKTPKYILMHFLRDVDSEAIQKALSEGILKGCGNACSTYEQDNINLSKLIASLGAFKKGNELGFSLLPQGTVKVQFNSKESGTVGSKDFSQLFLKIFLGSNPPSEELKSGLLGN